MQLLLDTLHTENTKALREDAVRNESILDRIPSGRWGTPEDLMGTIVFLCSMLQIISMVALLQLMADRWIDQYY